MKKILLVAVLVLLPLSAYADLKSMDAEALDEITAQEGVKIEIGGTHGALKTPADPSATPPTDAVYYFEDAMKITKSNSTTAWENDNGASKGAIVMYESLSQEIYVAGEIGITADTITTGTGDDVVKDSFVKIQIGKENTAADGDASNADAFDIFQTAKATEIYIQETALVEGSLKGASAANCLGTSYQAGGHTTVLGNIKISAM
ncbi:DUF6160 family protein [Desulfoluna spongiiphila]|uniref:DUF6160 domain-containing protein n=1 Tax=Desulfoluna spongiiphila TaxID=419481 RepID=A0A1G5DC30_9BACT|nr:DUF6160 family protein [Desulfoluna spongiiphila]SCY12399.1 hypothetical protein SAMN05216233_104110 [Desulfoluna spongiiphila]